jgi:hypothetical protein
MRLRNVTLLAVAGTIAGAMAVLPSRIPHKVPRVSLLQVTRTVANPLTSTSGPGNWLTGNILDDPKEMWSVEFEITNPDHSGILLSHEKVDVQFLDATGGWTGAFPSDSYQALREAIMGAFLEAESTARINMERIRVSVPSEAQRCKLVVRFRPLTAQERCREVLVKSGFWRRFPKTSAWISDRAASTKHWSEWRPEIDLPRVLIEQDVHNEAPAPNRRPRFPLGGLGDSDYAVCAPSASPAAVGEARRYACPIS